VPRECGGGVSSGGISISSATQAPVIPVHRSSRPPGIGGRDPSERLVVINWNDWVAINRNRWSSSAGARRLTLGSIADRYFCAVGHAMCGADIRARDLASKARRYGNRSISAFQRAGARNIGIPDVWTINTD
jgi:hypothetical protein